tara:strand:+ start:821 stop:1312 length:492 start_codon:yes stop_codon:yes gene_type:complete
MIETQTFNIEKKVCRDCNKNKDINLFYNRKSSKDGKSYICKDCKREINFIYRKNNKEKIRLTKQKYSKTDRAKKLKRESYYRNIESIRKKDRIRGKIYREKNRDKITSYLRNLKRKYTKDLHDTYIKQLIVKRSVLRPSEIPQEYIDAKKEHLKLKRHLKETI